MLDNQLNNQLDHQRNNKAALFLLTLLGLFSFSCSLTLPVFAQVNDETIASSRLQPAESASEKNKKTWEFEAHLEIRNTENRLNRPENKRSTGVHELSLGFKGSVQKELGYFIEAAVEQFNDESEFVLKEAYLDILPEHRWVRLKAGQLYYPVGWIAREDNWFISLPSYYGILFKGDKPLDTGAAIEIHPFKSPWVYLTASCFSGKVYRNQDGRDGEAISRPCEASLRSKTEYFEAYFTHFESHLAFYDPVNAQGIGLQTEFAPVSKWSWLKLGAVAEGFQISEKHQGGGETSSTAWTSYLYTDIYRFRLGWRDSETLRNIQLSGLQKTSSLIKEDLFRVEARVLSHLNLIYEDEFVRSDITLADRWALRLMSDWTF